MDCFVASLLAMTAERSGFKAQFPFFNAPSTHHLSTFSRSCTMLFAVVMTLVFAE